MFQTTNQKKSMFIVDFSCLSVKLPKDRKKKSNPNSSRCLAVNIIQSYCATRLFPMKGGDPGNMASLLTTSHQDMSSPKPLQGVSFPLPRGWPPARVRQARKHRGFGNESRRVLPDLPDLAGTELHHVLHHRSALPLWPHHLKSRGLSSASA